MNADDAARRYLLGDAAEDECLALEQEYFKDAGAAERIARVEEDLIEDYLDGRLSPDERDAFERHYLATPGHRIRLETIRRLRRRVPARTGASLWPWLALAAALVVATGTWWLVAPGSVRAPEIRTAERQTSAAPTGPAVKPPPPPAPPAPRVFAISLPPLSVRGPEAATAHVIPADTDVVLLQLQADAPALLEQPRIAIETVEGRQIWTGPAAAQIRPFDGTIASTNVPADRLPSNDYIVRLFARDAGGRERERARYFVRIRAR